MKTPEQALTEWTCDEVKFDYQQGQGSQSHNREQFTKLCEAFRNGLRPQDQSTGFLTSGSPGGLVSGGTLSRDRDSIDFLITQKSVASAKAAIDTFTVMMHAKIMQDEIPKIIDQYFMPMHLMHCENVQEVVTGLIQKVKL